MKCTHACDGLRTSSPIVCMLPINDELSEYLTQISKDKPGQPAVIPSLIGPHALQQLEWSDPLPPPLQWNIPLSLDTKPVIRNKLALYISACCSPGGSKFVFLTGANYSSRFCTRISLAASSKSLVCPCLASQTHYRIELMFTCPTLFATRK